MAAAALKSKVVTRPPQARKSTGGHWVVDRHINISVIFAVIVQTVGIIVWGTTLTVRVGELEAKIAPVSSIIERLARIETTSISTKEAISEIKALVTPRPK